MKKLYIAEDGTQFTSEVSCVTYESRILERHVVEHCPRTFDQLVFKSLITSEDVSKYIFKNIDKINEIVNTYNGK